VRDINMIYYNDSASLYNALPSSSQKFRCRTLPVYLWLQWSISSPEYSTSYIPNT